MTPIDSKLAQIYAQKQRDSEAAHAQKLADLAVRDPQIAAFQQMQRTRFATAARDILGSQKESAQRDFKRDILLIQGRIKQRLAALGLPEDHLSPTFECPTCRDTGFIGDIAGEPCACRKSLRVQLMREAAGISADKSQTFALFRADIFPDAEQSQRTLAAKALCERYADGVGLGGKLNLVLMGESGLGKTFLLNAVAESALDRSVPAMMMTAFNALAAMRDFHFGNTGDGNLLSQMIACDLLLIDDLGTEPMLRNITTEYLFMILNERMINRRHTAIATNLTPEELQSRYSERVLSRMLDRQQGEILRLRGKDLRFVGR